MDAARMSKWTSPTAIPDTEVRCSPSCVALGDLFSDGDTKLIVGHCGLRGMNMKLKVYKGIKEIAENTLADQPTAVMHFINELSSLPSVGVASGPYLLVYKNLKPFYKFTVPSSIINPIENQAWSAFQSNTVTAENLFMIISNLADEKGATTLTPMSQSLILTKTEDRADFLEKYQNKQLTNSASITCLQKMQKSSAEIIDVVVIGTEHGAVHLIDSQAFTVLVSYHFTSPPVQILVFGTYDVDYKLFVLTRSSEVFMVKKGPDVKVPISQPIITASSYVTSMVRIKKTLVLATSDHVVSFYNFKGKKLNEFRNEQRIIQLEYFEYSQKQFSGVLAMMEKEIRLYNDTYLLDVQKLDSPLSWIKYGQYGREEGSLILCFKDGSLKVRMFRRKASFEQREEINPHLAAYSMKLAIPKKTKIFIDQSQREKEQFEKMNQAYQKDLIMVKYKLTECYYDLVKSAASSTSSTVGLPIDINVDVHGFGPGFRLNIFLISSAPKPVYDMWLSPVCNSQLYDIVNPLIPVPILTPTHKYQFTTLVYCKEPEMASQEEIRILLVQEGRTTPIVTAVVKMPISEFEID